MNETAFGWKNLGALVLHEAGVYVHADGTIRVPYRRADQTVFREKVFAGKKSWWGPGEGLMPFGVDRLPESPKRYDRILILAEGESDTLAIRESIAVHNNRDVDVLGLPGASTWRTEWAAHTRSYGAVYVCGDGDAAGERFMEDVRSEDITRNVRWISLPPGEDARSILQSPTGIDVFFGLLDYADESVMMWNSFKHGHSPEAWTREMIRLREDRDR